MISLYVMFKKMKRGREKNGMYEQIVNSNSVETNERNTLNTTTR